MHVPLSTTVSRLPSADLLLFTRQSSSINRTRFLLQIYHVLLLLPLLPPLPPLPPPDIDSLGFKSNFLNSQLFIRFHINPFYTWARMAPIESFIPGSVWDSFRILSGSLGHRLGILLNRIQFSSFTVRVGLQFPGYGRYVDGR